MQHIYVNYIFSPYFTKCTWLAFWIWLLDTYVDFLYLVLLKLINSEKKSAKKFIKYPKLLWKYQLLFYDCKETEFSGKTFGTKCNINVYESFPYGSRGFACGRTQMTILTAAYRCFRTRTAINRRSVLLLTASCIHKTKLVVLFSVRLYCTGRNT